MERFLSAAGQRVEKNELSELSRDSTKFLVSLHQELLLPACYLSGVRDIQANTIVDEEAAMSTCMHDCT